MPFKTHRSTLPQTKTPRFGVEPLFLSTDSTGPLFSVSVFHNTGFFTETTSQIRISYSKIILSSRIHRRALCGASKRRFPKVLLLPVTSTKEMVALNPPKVSVSSERKTTTITAEELTTGAGRAKPHDVAKQRKQSFTAG